MVEKYGGWTMLLKFTSTDVNIKISRPVQKMFPFPSYVSSGNGDSLNVFCYKLLPKCPRTTKKVELCKQTLSNAGICNKCFGFKECNVTLHHAKTG